MSQASTKKRARNYTIDTLRLVLAFLVVWIHCGRSLALYNYGINETLGLIVTAFSILAVPIFFAISGYFLYAPSATKVQARCKKTKKRLLIIFIAWEIFQFIFSAIEGQSLGTLARSALDPEALAKLFFLNIPLFGGYYLWFIPALIYAVAILYVNSVFAKSNYTASLLLGIFGFCIGLIFSTYCDTFATNYATQAFMNTNWFGQGLIFTTLGFLIHKHQSTIMKIPRKSFAIFSAIAIFLYAIEFYNIYHDVGAYPIIFISQLMMPAVVAVVIIACLKHPHFGRKTPLPVFGQRYALYIYLLHVPISTVMLQLVFRDGLTENFATAVGYTTIIYLCAFALSAILVWLISLTQKIPSRLKVKK